MVKTLLVVYGNKPNWKINKIVYVVTPLITRFDYLW